MDQTVKDALRIAKSPRKPVRFHHTVARKGYQAGGHPEETVEEKASETVWQQPQAPAPVTQPDDAHQEAFIKEQLKGSAPQYDPAAGMHTAKEAGLMAAGMIPGTGLAAAAGKFPTAEGGFEPSLKEDISAGHYGSAFLKGLGAAGDIAQAVPVVGTAAGAAMKAPLAVKLATAMAPAARLAREAAPVAEAAREAAPVAREAEAALPPASVTGEVSFAPEMTKSQSQAAMKAAWEAGQGDTSKYKNWNHQWNMEEGPKFRAQPAEVAPTAAVPESAPTVDPAVSAYQRLVNPAGFYSRAHEAAMLELPAEPRTWQEMYSLLSKAPRVQAEELYWSGIHPEAFPASDKVTREQIAELIQKNFPMVEPDIRSGPKTKYAEHTVPGGTDYEERILRHQYNPETSNFKHPDVVTKYEPEIKSLVEEQDRLSKEIVHERKKYQDAVINPYIQNLRGEYVRKLLSMETPTSPAELEASRAARDAAAIEKKQAAEEHERLLREGRTGTPEFLAAREKAIEAHYKYEELAAWHRGLYESSEEGIHEDVSRMSPESIANYLGKHDEFTAVRLGASNDAQRLEELYRAQQTRQQDLKNRILEESKALAPYSPEYAQQKYTSSHWENTDNPVVHTRNSTRTGPNGEKIWHQEEMQSDWAQQGREKGFKGKPLTPKEKEEMFQMSNMFERTPEQEARYRELNDKRRASEEGIHQAPYTRDTEHWLELAAKDTLKEAIERGYDKIFITGGQEQAKRWANELRRAVDNVRWKRSAGELSPDESYALQDKIAQEMYGAPYRRLGNEESKAVARKMRLETQQPDTTVVYAKPVGSNEEHHFVVKQVEGPGGKPRFEIVDSSIPKAKGETLSSVIGGDLAKRVMAEESGNVPMKGYRMGSEGYAQTYERKAPSIYKKLLKSLDPEAKVESGNINTRATYDFPEVGLDAFSYFDAKPGFNPKWSKEHDMIINGLSAGKTMSEAVDQYASPEFAEWLAKTIGAGRRIEEEGVGGTYVQITPKMRQEYERLKQKFGAVFPAYKRGGKVDGNPRLRYTRPEDALRISRKYAR